MYGRFSGFFRTPTPYISKNPSRPPQMSADEEKKANNTDRYCLNWACKKMYKQINNHKKACKCHPGKWDFGYSGRDVSTALSGFDDDDPKRKQLWKPHWSCCTKGWEEEGCKRTWHRGEFIDEYK